MNDSLLDTGFAGGSTPEGGFATDYRIREVEARLDRRLSVVESQRERLRWTVRAMTIGFVGTLVALGGVLWASLPGDGVVVTESLSTGEVVLQDQDGVTRGRLATDSEGRAQLSLSDRDGQERLRMTVLADGSPGVTISGPDGRTRAVLGYLADGTTNLVFADAQGMSRAVFGLEPDGSTQVLFTDHAGAIRTLVGVGADGGPIVSIFEEEGQGGPSSRP
jgi:hypothetical protein